MKQVALVIREFVRRDAGVGNDICVWRVLAMRLMTAPRRYLALACAFPAMSAPLVSHFGLGAAGGNL